jgi:hypothetical protein
MLILFCLVPLGNPYDQNEYGAHPFYLQTLASSGAAHGVFVRSSNGMDVVLSSDQVEFRIIGGILEWYDPSSSLLNSELHFFVLTRVVSLSCLFHTLPGMCSSAPLTSK